MKKQVDEQRIDFNHGYHDGVFTVRQHLDTPTDNFGFGPNFTITHPEEIRTQHPNKTYAQGWLMGYYEALGGASRCQTSQYAWAAALKHGSVKIG